MAQDHECQQTQDTEKEDEQEPVPPRLVGIGIGIVQQSVALGIDEWVIRFAVFKFGHQQDANRVGQRAQVPGPAQPGGNQIGGHEKAGKEHLRDKEHGKEFHGEFRVFDAASEQDRERRTRHGERVSGRKEDAEIRLEADREECNDDLGE